MSVTEISASDSTGLPIKPNKILLARYVPDVVHKGAVARMMTLVRREIR